MSRPLIPERFRYRSMLDEEGTVAAKKGGWCHLCDVTFPVGERITFVRGAYKHFDDPSDRVHPDCFKELPDEPEHSNGDMPVVRGDKLPDGDRHRGSRYAMFVDVGEGYQPVWYTGDLKQLEGAVSITVEYFGFKDGR